MCCITVCLANCMHDKCTPALHLATRQKEFESPRCAFGYKQQAGSLILQGGCSTCSSLLTRDDAVQERLRHLRASRLGMHLHHPKWTHTNHRATRKLHYLHAFSIQLWIGNTSQNDSKHRGGDGIITDGNNIQVCAAG